MNATAGISPTPVATPATPAAPAVPTNPRMERGFPVTVPRRDQEPWGVHSSESSAAESGTQVPGAARIESNRSDRNPRLPNRRPGSDPTTVPRTGVNAGTRMQPPASRSVMVCTAMTLPVLSRPPVSDCMKRIGREVPTENTPKRSRLWGGP